MPRTYGIPWTRDQWSLKSLRDNETMAIEQDNERQRGGGHLLSVLATLK